MFCIIGSLAKMFVYINLYCDRRSEVRREDYKAVKTTQTAGLPTESSSTIGFSYLTGLPCFPKLDALG
jgi:hypothetical protein